MCSHWSFVSLIIKSNKHFLKKCVIISRLRCYYLHFERAFTHLGIGIFTTMCGLSTYLNSLGHMITKRMIILLQLLIELAPFKEVISTSLFNIFFQGNAANFQLLSCVTKWDSLVFRHILVNDLHFGCEHEMSEPVSSTFESALFPSIILLHFLEFMEIGTYFGNISILFCLVCVKWLISYMGGFRLQIFQYIYTVAIVEKSRNLRKIQQMAHLTSFSWMIVSELWL